MVAHQQNECPLILLQVEILLLHSYRQAVSFKWAI